MIALQSSGFWFMFGPAVWGLAGLLVGLLVGYRLGRKARRWF